MFGVNGPSPSWNFLIMGLVISWTLVWGRLYTVNGIGFSLAAVAVGFTTDVYVEAAVVAIISGSVLTVKDFSTSLPLNCPFYGCFGSLLFVSFSFGN